MCAHWTRGGEGEGYKKKIKAYSKSKTGCAPQAYVVRSDHDWGPRRSEEEKKGCSRNEARLLTGPVGADVPYSSRVS